MSEDDWFVGDPGDWDLGGDDWPRDDDDEIEALIEWEIDMETWHAAEDVIDLEWDLEIVQVCLICGRSISRTPDLWQRIQPHFPTLDDGHGDC